MLTWPAAGPKEEPACRQANGHLRLTANASSKYGEQHEAPPSRSSLPIHPPTKMPLALASREAGARREVVGGESCRRQEASGALVCLCLVQGHWRKIARARIETLRSSDIGIAEIS